MIDGNKKGQLGYVGRFLEGAFYWLPEGVQDFIDTKIKQIVKNHPRLHGFLGVENCEKVKKEMRELKPSPDFPDSPASPDSVAADIGT